MSQALFNLSDRVAPAHWATGYIGIPYRIGGRTREGLDCWGLVRLVYREQRGIELPDLPGIGTAPVLAQAREIAKGRANEWMELEQPKEECIVVMSQRKVLHHVGLWTAVDGGKVIHCWDGARVVADTIKMLKWIRGIAVMKFFEYGLHH